MAEEAVVEVVRLDIGEKLLFDDLSIRCLDAFFCRADTVECACQLSSGDVALRLHENHIAEDSNTVYRAFEIVGIVEFGKLRQLFEFEGTEEGIQRKLIRGFFGNAVVLESGTEHCAVTRVFCVVTEIVEAYVFGSERVVVAEELLAEEVESSKQATELLGIAFGERLQRLYYRVELGIRKRLHLFILR